MWPSMGLCQQWLRPLASFDKKEGSLYNFKLAAQIVQGFLMPILHKGTLCGLSLLLAFLYSVSALFAQEHSFVQGHESYSHYFGVGLGVVLVSRQS